ncbi:hypothetical protein ACOCEA_14900, partial [Maribacter sp. CXY002]
FEVRASGADIWGSADEFHFVYRELTGNGEIIARVTALEQTSGWSKAGVMIRNTLDDDSAFAYMSMSPIAGIGEPAHWLQHRNTVGEFMDADNSTPAVADAFPSYMRLVRVGNIITGYVSESNGNWSQVGNPISIPMFETVYVGLAVTSHNDGVVATATFDDVVVQGLAPSGNEPPVAVAGGTP